VPLLAMTGATAVHLLFWDDDQGHWLVNPTEPGQRALSLDNTRPGEFPVTAIRYAERTREPLVVDDAVTDDRFARDPYFTGIDRCSLLAAPVLGRGALRAMLLLENRLIRGAFSADRLDGIMMIGSQLAVSIDNALVYASLEHRVAERTEELAHANRRLSALSVTDALTGLANRRRLEEVLSAEWLRGQRTGAPLSVAMVDIDHFKVFNDRYGHSAGDTRLQQVASALREQVRDLDLVARYGGEEFSVVMPATDLRSALRVAERLRTAVRSTVAGTGLDTTISVGVATMVPSQDGSVEELIDRADVELYRAKRDGRDQVQPVTVFLDN
jgi:diguanylate cyclase (GGDEF)-like protein